jgi:hypothetical protein
MTLTLQHKMGDDLSELIAALKSSWRKTKSGAPWVRQVEKMGLEHYVTSIEFTYGQHGWHPHLHVLFFVAPGRSDSDLEVFREWVSMRFGSYLAKSGKYTSPIYGVNVIRGEKSIGDYVSKWGVDYEVAKSNVKSSGSGDTPFQLLERFASGDRVAGSLFVEYAHATKGLNQLVWSRGAKGFFGVDDMDDLSAAEEEPEGEILTWLYEDQFSVIVKKGLRAKLLDMADLGDVELLWKWLISVGVRPVDQSAPGYKSFDLGLLSFDAAVFDKYGFPVGWKSSM